MAQVTDWATLTSYITDVFDRSSDTAFTGRIDTFIGLAEDTWTPTLLNRRMETTATLVTGSDGTVALPADFYRLRSFGGSINAVNTNVPMIGPAAQFGLYPVDTTGSTQFAKIVGSTITTIPPNASLSLTLDYWALFVGLSASNTTNWIMTNYSTLYLYSTMAQAWLWLNKFDAAQAFDTKAQEVLDDITDKLGIDYYFNTDVVLDSPTP